MTTSRPWHGLHHHPGHQAKERLKQLQERVSDHSRPLSQADREGAERVIDDLKDAINKASNP